MDWLVRMNNAMDYIECNLADEISYEKVAQIACCSTYHFQRMFSFITDVPLSGYIRRRRLTLAAFELQTNGIKVIDVAMKRENLLSCLGFTGSLAGIGKNRFRKFHSFA